MAKMDVTRAMLVSPYAGTLVPAGRRADAAPPPAAEANATLPQPLRVAAAPPVKRVFDGDYLQAERNRRLVPGMDDAGGRLFDARRRISQGQLALRRDDAPQAGLAAYEANTAERLLTARERGSLINERV